MLMEHSFRVVIPMLKSRDINLLRSDVAANCHKFVELCKAAGYPVLVTNTVRDDEYQAYLYEQGRTRSGGIVTNSKVPTFHWVEAGLAFDICKNVKGQEYSDNNFWKGVSAIGKKMGFTWGGDWKTFVDKPHFQWDAGGKYTSTMVRAKKFPPAMPLYEEEDDMTEAEVIKIIEKYFADKEKKQVSSWAKASFEKAKKNGILDGTKPQGNATREQIAAVLDRLGLLD